MPPATPDVCARSLMAAVPAIMRFIRSQMRDHRENLTVPQFRTLVLLSHDGDPTMSKVAEHLGISLPAASRMVDGLVRRGLLERQTRAGDRRSVSLSLTSVGQRTFRAALHATEQMLTQHFKALSDKDLAQVAGAMDTLASLFALGEPAAKTANG
jgi:DNA-binding MarR family transcriptional regulator